MTTELIAVCRTCGRPSRLSVTVRWPNGEVRETTWVCEKGHRFLGGIYLDRGKLDLGLKNEAGE